MEQKWIHCESTILQWNKWKIIRSCQLCKTWCTPGNAFFHTVSPSLPRPLGVTNSVDTFWVWESGPPCSWASGSSSRNSAHKKATCLGDAGLLRKERGPWVSGPQAEIDSCTKAGRWRPSYAWESATVQEGRNHPATWLNLAELLGSEWNSKVVQVCTRSPHKLFLLAHDKLASPQRWL